MEWDGGSVNKKEPLARKKNIPPTKLNIPLWVYKKYPHPQKNNPSPVLPSLYHPYYLFKILSYLNEKI